MDAAGEPRGVSVLVILESVLGARRGCGRGCGCGGVVLDSDLPRHDTALLTGPRGIWRWQQMKQSSGIVEDWTRYHW